MIRYFKITSEQIDKWAIAGVDLDKKIESLLVIAGFDKSREISYHKSSKEDRCIFITQEETK